MDRDGRLEPVVQAGPKDVATRGYVGGDAARGRRAARTAEVGVEIFELGGPAVDDHAFDADRKSTRLNSSH